MKVLEDYQMSVIKDVPFLLLLEYPQAVAVVWWILDCGCIKMGCVSEEGDPIGQLVLTTGQPRPDEGTMVVCHKCITDSLPASKRIVKRGIVWGRPPEKGHEQFISKKVFGPRNKNLGPAIV
jgi:hypothetical protein